MSKENLAICRNCGAEYPASEAVTVEEELVCPTCAARTVVCACCGERIWLRNNVGNEHTILCEDCYDDRYARCVDCGRLLLQDEVNYLNEGDDYGYCAACYDRQKARAIHDYNYKPTPHFFGDGPRYFGVELEIDEGGECADCAEAILSVGNAKAYHLYCKHDGSLEDGIEIVSHPMSLHYHTHRVPWRQVLARAVSLGYTSHRAGTCGLHIHVSRRALGETCDAQEKVIARILYFFEKNWAEMLKFSRRTSRQLDQWACRYGYKDTPSEMIEHIKKGHSNGRYAAINLTNDDTVEFRMFNGTLKYNTFIATLQLIDLICDVALSFSDEQMRALSWSDFVGRCTQPELVQYLKERRLYVNEPVAAEEDM